MQKDIIFTCRIAPLIIIGLFLDIEGFITDVFVKFDNRVKLSS